MEDRLFYCTVSLLSACSWALGAILWRRLGEQLSSYSMNLGKTVIGSFCLGLILFYFGFEQIDLRSFLFLVFSGLIGIAIGDTFFFRSLMALGPRRASLMGSLNPVVIAIAAATLLGERPAPGVWAGIITTTLGVGWVLWERNSSAGSSVELRSTGLRYGVLSLLCTAVAVLLAKVGVNSVPPAQAALIRLAAGAFGMAAWGIFRSELGVWVAPYRRGMLLVKVTSVVLIVVIGGFWFSLLALKHIDAAIAGTLNATSPLFILPMSMVLMKEKVSFRAFIGAAIAVLGVALIMRG